MRTFEDCKAEIFRRSEKRIKERKRARKRVLACCIPLCLMLVVGGLYLGSLLEPMDEVARTNAGPTSVPDRELGGSDVVLHGKVVRDVSVTLVEGTGKAAVSKKVTDTETMVDLYGCMAKYFDLSGAESIGGMDGTDGVTGATGKESNTNGTDRDTIEDELKFKYALDEKPADYTLVFRASTGEETVLRLLENNLYNETTGCVVTLSDGQLAELKSKLEQAVAKED